MNIHHERVNARVITAKALFINNCSIPLSLNVARIEEAIYFSYEALLWYIDINIETLAIVYHSSKLADQIKL